MKKITFILFAFLLLMNLSQSEISNADDPLTEEQEQEINRIFDDFYYNQFSMSSNVFRKGSKCTKCKTIVDGLKSILMLKFGRKGLHKLLVLICKKAKLREDMCVPVIDKYAPGMLDNIISYIFNSNEVCYLINACDDRPRRLHADDYARRLLKDKPINLTHPPIDVNAKTLRMAVVTDVHLDLNYQEGTKANCDLPLCCREPISDPEKDLVSGKYGFMGKCDGTKEIVKTFAQKVAELKPDFIINNGDNAAHNVWNVSQEEVTNATNYTINELISQVGNDVPIYPCLGNHEISPVDQFEGEEKEFLLNQGEIYKRFLTNEAYETFRHFGYYTQLHKDTNIRIVSLNSLVCDSFNFNLLRTTADSQQMFIWLEKVMREAEANNEAVYLLNHISTGSTQYTFECGKRIKAIYDRFQHIIKAYLSGHSHSEEIMKVTEYFDHSKVIGINYLCSGLTPYSAYNPSFRMFLIDSNTKMLKDYEQYRFDLNESNRLKEPIWYLSYKGSELFKVNYLNETFAMSKVEIEGEYLIRKGTDTQMARDSAYDPGRIFETQCTLDNDLFQTYFQCINPKFSFSTSWLYYIMNVIEGEWKEVNLLKLVE